MLVKNYNNFKDKKKKIKFSMLFNIYEQNRKKYLFYYAIEFI